MSEIITYQQCPACNSAAISKVFSCKDETVSNEFFEIWQCSVCTLRFTQNVPGEQAIGAYYQSSDYVSHTDTKKGLINSLYHLVRNHTLKSKQALLDKLVGKPTATLLDAGAGTGAFAHTMQKHGWTVQGIEPDDNARKIAKDNYGLDFQTPDKLELLQNQSFDVVTLWHVLEHVHDLHHYLESFFRLLKEDGTLVIAVPNYTSNDAEVYGNCWAAYDVPRHLYHFSPKSMDILLNKHGFVITERKPMWFDSFYVSMLSEKHRANKGNIVKAFWNGLSSNVKAVGDNSRCSSIIYIAKKTKK
jgi:SAM-dependent methyltransferase